MNTGEILNQGKKPMCVGFATHSALKHYGINVTPDEIYHQAKRYDEVKGEDYNGTQTVGALRYLKDHKLIQNFKRIKLSDIDQYVGKHPILVGYNTTRRFRQGQFKTYHLIDMIKEVEVDYYHASLIVGGNDSSVRIQNSWGTKWADGGYCNMSKEALKHCYHSLYIMNQPEKPKKSKPKWILPLAIGGIALGVLAVILTR